MGVTRRQARTVVKEAHKEWLDAFNDEDINQRDLLFQCLGRLERTARKAEESGNFAHPRLPHFPWHRWRDVVPLIALGKELPNA